MKRQDFFTVKINLVDNSIKVKDFTTPSVPADLQAGQFLHVGYYKPVRQFYLDFKVLNLVATTVTFEYYNGVDWVKLPNMVDETEDFIKSGFVYWDRPADWKSIAVDNTEAFYIRMSAADNLSVETEINGINVLLSSDKDLIGIRSNIVSKHNNGISWIEKHEAAREHILQQLRNLGHKKLADTPVDSPVDGTEDTLTFSGINQFDLFNPFELREAAKWYCLHFIYIDELSDEEDDKWERAGLRHEKRASEAMNVYMLRLDKDDDGIESAEENEGDTGINLDFS